MVTFLIIFFRWGDTTTDTTELVSIKGWHHFFFFTLYLFIVPCHHSCLMDCLKTKNLPLFWKTMKVPDSEVNELIQKLFLGGNQKHKPCQHTQLWNFILVSADLNTGWSYGTKLNPNHIIHLYSCHEAQGIYRTNESRSFSLKNQLGGHMGIDATNCDATFCPCPTYTSMLFWEENLTHNQRSYTKDVPPLFFISYNGNVRTACSVCLCPLCSFWVRPGLGLHSPSPFCLSVSLSTLMRDDSSYPWLVAGNGEMMIERRERTKENCIGLLLHI